VRLPEVIFVQTLVSDGTRFDGMLASLLGAVVGGLSVFATQLYFEKKRQAADHRDRDYELYLSINEIINDVYGLASAYISMFDRASWPVKPMELVRPVLSQCPENVQARSHIVSTFFGTHSDNLAHEFHVLQKARNIIISTNNKFVEAHARAISELAQLGMLGPNMSMSNVLDTRVADHKIAIIRAQEAESLLKQLLRNFLEFGPTAEKFKVRYNRFKEHHASPRLRTTTIKWEDESKFAETFYL